MKTIYKEDIVQGLTELGLKQGDVVIVHTYIVKKYWICMWRSTGCDRSSN